MANCAECNQTLIKDEPKLSNMPDGSTLTLDEFVYLHYENGRPMDYISYLTITDGDKIIYSRCPLRVNHPLTLNGLTLYQFSGGKWAVVITL